MLQLMYITKDTNVIKIADEAGVDRIFIDLESLGKDERQKGLDTVKNHHTFEDVLIASSTVKHAKVLVRINPIHDACEGYVSSEEEIDTVIKNGADIIMLPYFKTAEEVRKFLSFVNGRCRTMLLVETASAVINLDEILGIPGIDEVHIGLNDLSIDLKQTFMFEPLAYGLVDELANKCKARSIPFGFGGIARLGFGDIPSENIICEHYRLGSSFAILSRSFCNAYIIPSEQLKETFSMEVNKIREFESRASKFTEEQFNKNKLVVEKMVTKMAKKGI